MKNKIYRFIHKISFVLVVSFVFLTLQLQNAYSQEEEIICPPNSSLSGDQCLCNSGYVAINGQDVCVLESQVCAKYGPSHLVGVDCVCNDGYGILPGGSTCQNLSNACAGFNAIWSASKNDCICAAGLHEDTTLNKCVPDAVATSKVDDTKPTVEVKPTVSAIPTTTIETKPTIQVSSTPIPTSSTNSFAEVDDLMQTEYGKLNPNIQSVIKENKTETIKIAESPFTPEFNLYQDTDKNQPISKESIEKSMNLIPQEEQNSVNQQLDVLNAFSDSLDTEVNLQINGVGEKFEEAFIEQKYSKDLQEWKNKVSDAEKKLKLKSGVEIKEYDDAIEMESRLKTQIATLEKIVGYNHLRCLESTKVMKFENMPSDYREYFKNQSAENLFEEAAEGQSFEKASRNVIGTQAQIRELKDMLNNKYPENWKTKYLDVPNQPSREKAVQKENIFNAFEKLKNK